MKFDEVLQHIGEFGPYQKRIAFLAGVPILFTAFHKLVWVFLGAVPLHRCLLPGEDIWNTSYWDPPTNQTLSTFWDKKNAEWSRCHLIPSNSSVDDAEETLISCDSWVYDLSQYYSTVVTDFNLVCNQNWLRAAVHSVNVIGEVIGALLFGTLADRIGRKKVLLICVLMEALCGLAVGIIHNFVAFIIFRFLVGIFTQGLIVTCYVVVMEFVGRSSRVFIGTSINYFFALGYVILAGLAYIFRHWPYLQLSISIPGLLFVFCFRWIPESVRWLLTQNREFEALAIIRKAAKINGAQLPKEVLLKGIELSTTSKKNVNLFAVFKYRNLRKRAIIMCYAWLVNSAIYLGLALNTSNLGGNDYINFLISALLEFPAYSLCIFIIPRSGRRYSILVSMLLGGLSLIATLFVPTDMVSVVVTLANIGKFGITVSYTIVFIFAAELYPTAVRNSLVGINSTSARVGGILASFLILLADYWRPLPMIILGAMSVSAGLLCLLLPETQGKSLPDTMEEGENL